MISTLRSLKYRFLHAKSILKECGLNVFSPNVIFDVGANDGSTFLEIARLLPWISVHAFEPTPTLVQRIQNASQGIRNFCLIPKAVGEQPGFLPFNVAGRGDWGCSSLLEFSDDLEQTWPGRDDFVVTERIEIEVITLADYIQARNIRKVDFLHIDTQGTDLGVLRSLGDAIARVRAGVVEVPASKSVMLYKNQHSKEEMIAFLKEHRFKIWKEVEQQNEINLYFRSESQ